MMIKSVRLPNTAQLSVYPQKSISNSAHSIFHFIFDVLSVDEYFFPLENFFTDKIFGLYFYEKSLVNLHFS